MGALPQPNIRRSTKPAPVTGNRKPPVSTEQSGVKASDTRRSFEGTFVGFEVWFLQALRRGCNSLAERNLVDYVAELANEREKGNPFGCTPAIMTQDLADAIGCTRQNVNCSAGAWFGPEGLIERTDGPVAKRAGVIEKNADNRAYSYRIRAEYAREWSERRFKAREEAKAKKAAELEAAAEEQPDDAVEQRKTLTYQLAKPVRVGPGKLFKLPESAAAAVQNCTAIATTRDGTIRHLEIFARDGEDVLLFDFEAAAKPVPIDKSTCRSPLPSPSQEKPVIDKSTCRSADTDVANKGLTSLSAALDERGLVIARRRVVILETIISGIPLSFFAGILDEKIRKARAKKQAYSTAWLETTARDAAEAWAEHERVAAATEPEPEQAAAACLRCGNSGIVEWHPGEYTISDMVQAIEGGREYCDCPAAAVTRDLVAPALMRRSS